MFFIPFGTRENTRKLHWPLITTLLVITNVLVFLYEAYLLANYGEVGLANFVGQYAAIPASIVQNPLQVSLVSSMFLHAGLLHIAGNMLYLLPFGDNVEDRLGHVRYLLFYLLCGIAGTLAHVALAPGSITPMLGASGAIAGVLGGYLALHPSGTVKGFLFIIIILLRVDLPAFVFIGYWFIMQLFSGVASLGASADTGGIAFMAHVGGFIAGLILAPLLAFTAPRRPQAQFVD